MQLDGWGALGHQRQELVALDRVLGLLARPARVGAGLPVGLHDELRGLGVTVGRSRGRKRLIEQVWQRKRPLMRQLNAVNDPLPPCA